MLHAIRIVTAAQVRKLWVSAKALALSDDDLHTIVREVTGRESIRALTCEEAARVIDRLVRAGAEGTTAPRPRYQRPDPLPPNVIELATQKQVDTISRLLWHLNWEPGDPYFRACVKQAIGRVNIRTKPEASHAIDMLRAKLKDLGLEGQVASSHRHPESGTASAKAPNADTDEEADWPDPPERPVEEDKAG